MPEPRTVLVAPEHHKLMEYDREVLVELHHNAHQYTVLRLSKVEALSLLHQLQEHLEEYPRG